ncbi:MAG: universal stress protein [Flavobacteriaceae bacterium]|nr:universal stress protein [Flavobacteriaceae bacterium]
MKRIILPSDFSENAYNAISYALQLFKDEKCTFYLLNTYTPVLYDSEYMYHNPTVSLDEIYSSNSKKGLKRLEKRINKEFNNPKHRFEKLSVFNFLIDEINFQIEEKNIDLVVMGTKGATGAQEILFGTQTIHTIKKSKCPVLAIPSDYEFKSLKNILLPSDLSIGFRENQLEILKNIATKNKANIHILHVMQDAELSKIQKDGKATLTNYFKNNSIKFHFLGDRDIQEAINEFQKDHKVDMLSMINNKHSFFENLFFKPVVHKIGFHVKVPFLVVPSGKYSGSGIL